MTSKLLNGLIPRIDCTEDKTKSLITLVGRRASSNSLSVVEWFAPV